MRCWTAFSELLPIRDESLAWNISCVTDVNETKQLMSAWGQHTEKRGGGELTAEGRCFSCDPPLLVESINVALLFSLNTESHPGFYHTSNVLLIVI